MTFEEWLRMQEYAENTIRSQLSRIDRIRRGYPDIDAQYDRDGFSQLMLDFTYTKRDEDAKKKNPTRLAIDENLYHSLSTYRSTLGRYIRFKQTIASGLEQRPVVVDIVDDHDVPIGFERDMQNALRLNIAQLELGLRIDDDGVEKRVESGFIDITARDNKNKVVVIELKTGVAGQRAVAQILSYMGDVAVEEDSFEIRGKLVAFEFDKKAVAAAKMVPNLELVKYRFHFDFEAT